MKVLPVTLYCAGLGCLVSVACQPSSLALSTDEPHVQSSSPPARPLDSETTAFYDYLDVAEKLIQQPPDDRFFGITRLPNAHNKYVSVSIDLRKELQKLGNERVLTVLTYGRIGQPQERFRIRASNFAPELPYEDALKAELTRFSKAPDRKWDGTLPDRQPLIRMVARKIIPIDVGCYGCHTGIPVGEPIGIIAIVSAEPERSPQNSTKPPGNR
jgi:hypothetical protein